MNVIDIILLLGNCMNKKKKKKKKISVITSPTIDSHSEKQIIKSNIK